MADYRYAYNGPEEGTAKAVLLDVPISTKVSIEIANFLKGKTTEKADKYLELVMQKKEAIPFKRFTDGVGHKRGPMDAGRYPYKASEHFLKLIRLVEANASQKGLGDELIIKHIAVQKASTPYHNGRQGRRQMKRSHIEMVVEEIKTAEKKTKPKNDSSSKPKAEAPKTEKPVAKKSETPKIKDDKPVAKKEGAEKPIVASKEPVKKESTPEAKAEESPKKESDPAKKEAEKPASDKGETQE